MGVSRHVAVIGVLALAAWASPSAAQTSTDPSNPSAGGSMQSPPAQAQPQTVSPSSPKRGHPAAVDAQSIVGTKVRNSEGTEIGKVDRVMIDPASGKVHSLIITAGGTVLGGGKTVSVPWESAKIARDPQKAENLVVVVEQPQLETAPAASPRTDQKKQ